jgi:septal ring factor EnvC (AmiA/AmiB activator)
MKKHLRWLVFLTAFCGMGISMPSCPGQQAMQQQIDALQTSNADLTKKVQTLTTQLESANADLTQIKQVLPQMTNVIQAQKGALDQLDASVKELDSKVAKIGTKKKGR